MSACIRATRTPGVANDVHSALNPTAHARVLRPRSSDGIAAIFAEARRRGQRCALAGARHAMGGQQFARGGWLVDCSALAGVEDFDGGRGLVRAGAGIRWPALQQFLATQRSGEGHGWAIRQKQTGADDFSLGGALAANIHGRGLDQPPLVADIESFALVTPDLQQFEVSRDSHAEWFGRVIGGYGLFGAARAVTLRLSKRRKLQRTVRLATSDELPDALAGQQQAGACYGDFQFAIDPGSPDFLRLGVLSCYRPLPPDAPMPAARRQLSAADWRQLLWLAHVDKSRAFNRYAAFYLATDGQRYWSDDHQFGVYLDGYHRQIDARLGCVGSELISELYVPRPALPRFLDALAGCLRAQLADPIYGTVRLVERDRETLLPWAREPWACVVINLHVRHDSDGIAAVAAQKRAMIDVALAFGGGFYLTYHRHASARQLRAAHPAIDAFVACKRQVDPDQVLASDWWLALCHSLAA